MLELRIFVSSPGDVAQERLVAERVVARLGAEFAGVAALEAYFWEYEPMVITQDYQEQIPPPSQFDVVLCILWSRMGSRLHSKYQRPDGRAYRSGTEYELADAAAAWSARGTPDILVWLNKSEPVVPLGAPDRDTRVRQWESLREFLEEWTRDEREHTFKGAINRYSRLDEFEEKLETALRKIVMRRLGAQTELPRPQPSWNGSPFRGLEAFQPVHAPIFFGRTAAAETVLRRLQRRMPPRAESSAGSTLPSAAVESAQGAGLVVILGASGSGKSSLAMAGVLPQLVRPGVIGGVGVWRAASFQPGRSGADLFHALAAALLDREALPELQEDGTDPASLANRLRHDPAVVVESIRGGLRQVADKELARQRGELEARLARCDAEHRAGDRQYLESTLADLRAPRVCLALLVDQFEEVFTSGAPEEERRRFATALAALARSGLAAVVLTVRSDFYGSYQLLPELPALSAGEADDVSGIVDLLPPTPTEIGQMIRLPAAAAGLRYEAHPSSGEPLDEAIRDQAAARPEATPLLEHLLETLYLRQELRGDGILRWTDFEAVGGLRGALKSHADDLYAALSPAAREAVPAVLRALVSVEPAGARGEGARDAVVRRTAGWSEIASNPAAVEAAEAFIAARLLVSDRDADGRRTVTLAHETLLTEWDLARECVETNRDFLRVRARVSAARGHWESADRDPGLLLPAGRSLTEAEDELRRHPHGFSEAETAFIQASSAHARHAERRARRRRHAVLAALTTLTLLAAAAAAAASHRAKKEEEARQMEATAREDSNSVVDASNEFLHRLWNSHSGWMMKLARDQPDLARPFFERADALCDTMAENPRLLKVDTLDVHWGVLTEYAGFIGTSGNYREAAALRQKATSRFVQLAHARPDLPLSLGRFAHLATLEAIDLGRAQLPDRAVARLEQHLRELETLPSGNEGPEARDLARLSLMNALAEARIAAGDPEGAEIAAAALAAAIREMSGRAGLSADARSQLFEIDVEARLAALDRHLARGNDSALDALSAELWAFADEKGEGGADAEGAYRPPPALHARVYRTLGQIAIERDRLDEAVRAYRKAGEIGTVAGETSAGGFKESQDLANVYALASALMHAHQFNEARTLLLRELETVAPAAAQYPHNFDLQGSYSVARVLLGVLHYLAGDYAEAAAIAERLHDTVASRADPADPARLTEWYNYKTLLAIWFRSAIKLGDLAKAAELDEKIWNFAESIATAAPGDPPDVALIRRFARFDLWLTRGELLAVRGDDLAEAARLLEQGVAGSRERMELTNETSPLAHEELAEYEAMLADVKARLAQGGAAPAEPGAAPPPPRPGADDPPP